MRKFEGGASGGVAKVVGAEELLAQLSDEDLEEPVGDGEEVSTHSSDADSEEEIARRAVGASLGRSVLSGCGGKQDKAGPSGVLFTCDMLHRQVVVGDGDATRRSWVTGSCEDADDFHVLSMSQWARASFADGAVVAVWAEGAEGPVGLGVDSFLRFGRVLTSRFVEDEPAGGSGSMGEDKIVLTLAAGSVGGAPVGSLREVHYVLDAGVRDAFGEAVWVLQPRARWWKGPKSRGRRRGSVDMDHRNELAQGRLVSRVRIVPVGEVPVAVAKYEVPLREEALRAVHADQTIRTRMVVFHCNWCNERFATFHPAYWPPWEVWQEMELLRRGSDGVALCNIEVDSWEELPPFEEDPAVGGVAQVYRGTCRGCAVDMRRQREMPPEGVAAEAVRVIPKRSAYNFMDPIFTFPRDELQGLFDQASLVEEMLVALEHMQVNMVTVKGRGTGLARFKKNVISFVQDTLGFAQRHSMLREFRVHDRVNSTRGPGAEVDRPRVVPTPVDPYADYARDGSGFVVFPGTVVERLGNGQLRVRYDCGAEGVELEEHLVARVRMPWSPKDLKGQLVIMLRRSLGRGRGYLEGLEVRWGLVARILRALCRPGVWGPEDRRGPMHKYYDSGLFDLASGRGGSVEADETLLRQWYGEDLSQPSEEGPEGLRRVGLDVREVG